MVNQKGQLKIQQMAFVLIAVAIFFALVGLFFLVYRLNSLEDTATSLEEQNALLLASKLANSPEFSCEASFGNEKISCIDFDKVFALKKNIATYEGFWGVENIEVRILYPELQEEISCTEQNYPTCNLLQLKDQPVTGFDASNFVTICHKEKIKGTVTNICQLGKILVSYEAQQL